MRLPNFFVVGAPRCATTFSYTYLRRHPDVFLPAKKEPRYHCRDLDTGTPLDARFFIRDRDEYLALFRDAEQEKRVGETCPFNLFSKVAARSIRDMSPDAKIIIQIRNPIDQMYSFHAVRIRAGVENIRDFEAALGAEADRREGLRLPARARNIHMYQYRAVASFSEQIARYFDTFPRENVRVLVYDDLVRDPDDTFRRTLEFLEIDPDHEPLRVVNANREFRSRRLKEATAARGLAGSVKRILPDRLQAAVRPFTRSLYAWNIRERPRPPMDPLVRERLAKEFEPEVARLSALLDRDLGAIW